MSPVERGMGSGFIVGAIRGAVAGGVAVGLARVLVAAWPLIALLVFVAPPLAYFWVEWRHPRTISASLGKRLARGWVVAGTSVAALIVSVAAAGEHARITEWAALLAGGVVAAACVGACEGAAARASTEQAGVAVRALSGPMTVLALAAADVSVVSIGWGMSPVYAATALVARAEPEAVLAAVVASVGFSLAAVLAGTPRPGTSLEERIRRAAHFSVAFGLAFAGATTVGTRSASVFVPALWVAGAIGTFAVVLLYSLGMLAARPVSLRVSRWLEPGSSWLDRRDRSLRHGAHVAFAERAIATGELERALREARSAFELSWDDPWLVGARRDDTRRLAALILEAEHWDELAGLPKDLPERTFLEAEALRLRGRAADAVALLRGALARRELSPRTLASVHSVLALAEADLGHDELASSELAGLRVTSATEGPLLASHGFGRVADYLEFKRRASGGAGSATR